MGINFPFFLIYSFNFNTTRNNNFTLSAKFSGHVFSNFCDLNNTASRDTERERENAKT
jgi:hypothetical protein